MSSHVITWSSAFIIMVIGCLAKNPYLCAYGIFGGLTAIYLSNWGDKE